jgi:SAM-dependent methyltransferase
VPADFNDMIHAERGRLLRQLPKGAKVFCSAGCAGAWYFDWIAENYGHVDRHIGIELYLPKPDQLPDNVVWIKNSVADMTDVGTASVDLLFSGQNLEHLYYDDIQGFFREASRVLKIGGHLCIDSPNRLVTKELGYIQPQHVLEFSREDVARMVEAAGFELVAEHGIWSSREGERQVADITATEETNDVRLESAHESPDEAFIWWVVARKIGSPLPDLAETIEKIVVERFAPFVVARFRKGIGEVAAIEGTETIIAVEPALHGPVIFGPYVPLTEGDYVATWTVKFETADGAVSVAVTTNAGQSRLGGRYVAAADGAIGEWREIEVPFTIGEYTDGVETPVLTHGTKALIRFGSHILRQ